MGVWLAILGLPSMTVTRGCEEEIKEALGYFGIVIPPTTAASRKDWHETEIKTARGSLTEMNLKNSFQFFELKILKILTKYFHALLWDK